MAVAVVLAVVAVAVVGLAAVRLTQTEEDPDVLVIGDSLTVGAQDVGLGEPTGGGATRWKIDAVSGRTTNQGVEVAEAIDASQFRTVIVALGTNDYLDTAEAYGARIDVMMAALGDHPDVRWMNVDTGTEKLSPAAEGVNAALEAAAARYPNLTIVDWDAEMAARPDADELRAGDGVHYSTAGAEVRRDATQAAAG